MKHTKKIIFTTIALDLIGLTIIFPVLTVFKKQFGVGDVMVGIVGATYALCSFLSAPYLGRLSDRFGRKKILFLSVTGSAIGWFITAFAGNIWWVLIGRVIDWVTAGNITIAQAILSDISRDEKERAGYYGIFGMMFGLSMIVWPLLGGWLVTFGYIWPFVVAGAISALNAVFILTQLEETHMPSPVTAARDHTFAVFRALTRSPLARYLWLSFVVGLWAGVYRNSFALYMEGFYHLTEKQISYVLAAVGIFMAFCQGYLLSRFWLKKFLPRQVVYISLVASIILFTLTACYDQITQPWIFVWLILEVSMIFFTIAMWPVLQSEGISHADPNQRGEVNGYYASLWSLTGILGPFLGALMISAHISPLWAASVGSLIGLVIFRRLR